jgi:peptide-methionine (S)-S-oxide reductase
MGRKPSEAAMRIKSWKLGVGILGAFGIAALGVVVACARADRGAPKPELETPVQVGVLPPMQLPDPKEPAPLPKVAPGQALAIFAGGCFWCMEKPFEQLNGVLHVTSGFTGGRTKNARYDDVSAGGTGHTEAVRIVYDPAKISYARLVEVFWHNIDPFSHNGQFCDRGSQYRSGIFYLDAEQERIARQSKERHEARFKRNVATEITAASDFFAAEEYHQDFYRKNPARYSSYRKGCGRDARLREVWGAAAGH